MRLCHGGTAILSETPEIYGVEHTLTRRARSREVGEKLIARIRWWKDEYTVGRDTQINGIVSPGNQDGQVLQLGIDEGPLIDRDYFRTALALAKQWQQDWEEAQEQMIQVTAPRLQRAGNVVWLHIRAAQNDREGMERAIAELADDNPPRLIVEPTEELRLRFLEKKQGVHSVQWLREREIDCLALAA